MDGIAEIYSDYLIGSFGLSNLLNGEISHDKITRFLSSTLKTSQDLWQFVKPIIRQIESDNSCLIIDDSIDDSIEEKPYTDKNAIIICRHFHHSERVLVKGINFLSCLYQTADITLPAGFELVSKTEVCIDPKDSKEKRRSQFQRTNWHTTKSNMPSRIKLSFVLCYSMFGFLELVMNFRHLK